MLRAPWIAVFTAALAVAAPAIAQDEAEPPAATPIEAAAEAWQLGQVAKAGKLYEEALAGGGLAPSETLAAFVRVGAWRASLGKNDAALAAFRSAAVIDPAFELPAELGPRGKTLAQRAQTEAAGREALALTLDLPDAAEAGQPIRVAATLPETLVPLFESVRVEVQDKAGKAEHQEEAAPAALVEVLVPPRTFHPGATLEVRVAAVDAQHNEWVRATGTIRVKAAPLAPVVEPPPPPPPPPPPGFWETKWPFVAGGAAAVVVGVIVVAAVAGGGSDVAEVSAPTWRTRADSR